MEYNIPGNPLVLLKPSIVEPVTQVRRIILEVLRREGSMPFRLLVQRVAGEVHRLELREGAWMLDLGMFRSSLFIPSVAEEIKAGHGNTLGDQRAILGIHGVKLAGVIKMDVLKVPRSRNISGHNFYLI